MSARCNSFDQQFNKERAPSSWSRKVGWRASGVICTIWMKAAQGPLCSALVRLCLSIWATEHAFLTGSDSPSNGQEECKGAEEGPGFPGGPSLPLRPLLIPAYWALPGLCPQWTSREPCAFTALCSCFPFCQKSPSLLILLVNSQAPSAGESPSPGELLGPLLPPPLPAP